MDGEDTESVIKVLPELPLRRPGLKVAVCGGDQPYIGADRLVAANTLESLLLEHTQHLGLGGRRHVADLVEEQRATRALLELADAAAIGTGERALFVAEQLALQQVFRNGGAVEGQKWGLSAGAVLVDSASDELLAGAALP